MNTYLFVWKPEIWPWETFDENIKQLYTSGNYIEDWGCANKNALIGDKFYLIKLGKPSKKFGSLKGIIASGTIVSIPYYKKDFRNENKMK